MIFGKAYKTFLLKLPSIFYTFFFRTGSQGSWYPSPAVYGREAGYTLDRSPVHRRQHKDTEDKQPLIPKGNLEKPVNLRVTFLECGRKPEYLERTHACTGRTCKGNSTTNCATVQPVF
ncbi:hypothetical protein AMECASPLE_010334 [Ameca splendens]|uniref:Secreted protein n=1 Tax=Ameca splendens TaxID=208324 RepID=A0ABV0ZBM4_9TELE